MGDNCPLLSTGPVNHSNKGKLQGAREQNESAHHVLTVLSLWGPGPICMCAVAQLCPTLYRLWPARLLCPWNSPGKNTGVGCHLILLGIQPSWDSNLHLLCLLHWQGDSLPMHDPGSWSHLRAFITCSKA